MRAHTVVDLQAATREDLERYGREKEFEYRALSKTCFEMREKLIECENEMYRIAKALDRECLRAPKR